MSQLSQLSLVENLSLEKMTITTTWKKTTEWKELLGHKTARTWHFSTSLNKSIDDSWRMVKQCCHLCPNAGQPRFLASGSMREAVVWWYGQRLKFGSR